MQFADSSLEFGMFDAYAALGIVFKPEKVIKAQEACITSPR